MPVKQLHKLISTEQLSQELIHLILDKARSFLLRSDPQQNFHQALQGKIVANLFFEPSTRTRNSFEIAAKRLGAIVLSPDMNSSALQKGESLLDTIHTFEAMGIDAFVIRHSDNGIVSWIDNQLKSDTIIINAGEGSLQHPTQALLDLLTIAQHSKDWSSLSVAIIGDVRHSRVAHSLVNCLQTMGVPDIRLVAPDSLLPKDPWPNTVRTTSLADGLNKADVVVTLRLQKERIAKENAVDEQLFQQNFSLTKERLALAKSSAVVLHPGPLNRHIEISPEVADGPQSLIMTQVRNGIAIRMAILHLLLAN